MPGDEEAAVLTSNTFMYVFWWLSWTQCITSTSLPAGCGCPSGWELGLRGPAPGEPQYRPADLVDFLVQRSFRSYQQASALDTTLAFLSRARKQTQGQPSHHVTVAGSVQVALVHTQACAGGAFVQLQAEGGAHAAAPDHHKLSAES